MSGGQFIIFYLFIVLPAVLAVMLLVERRRT